MPFNSEKVSQLIRSKGIKAKEYFSFVYPERSGNASYTDIVKNFNPKAETIERIADLLQCPIDELFDRNVDKSSGDRITADNNSTAFKGTYTCDPRLLDIIQARDRQLDMAQSQIDRLLELLEEKKKVSIR